MAATQICNCLFINKSIFKNWHRGYKIAVKTHKKGLKRPVLGGVIFIFCKGRRKEALVANYNFFMESPVVIVYPDFFGALFIVPFSWRLWPWMGGVNRLSPVPARRLAFIKPP